MCVMDVYPLQLQGKGLVRVGIRSHKQSREEAYTTMPRDSANIKHLMNEESGIGKELAEVAGERQCPLHCKHAGIQTNT